MMINKYNVKNKKLKRRSIKNKNKLNAYYIFMKKCVGCVK